MDNNVKRVLLLVIGVISICSFLYAVFFLGANYSCTLAGGVLMKNVHGLRCVDIDNIDLCFDYGVVVEKPVSGFNFNLSFNISDDWLGVD